MRRTPPSLPVALLFACILLVPALARAAGNAWHIPEGAEPGIANMRLPLVGAPADAAVSIYSGNQFQGPGNPGNQLEQDSAVLWRRAGDSAWTEAPLAFHSQSGNNKYFSADLPAGTFLPGDVVEYYLRIAYSDQATTFVHGRDAQSFATEAEAVAQSGPFSFPVLWPLTASGSFATVKAADREVRVHEDSGHIVLLGPDLAGRALASSVTIAPSLAKIDGSWSALGAVLSSTPIAGGVEITQALGASLTAIAQLTLSDEGVMKCEVVDWGGATPTETRVTAPSTADEHFYGFGEKFNALDQAGKRVRMLTADFAGDKGDKSYKVVPWFLSTKGYGFWLDSSAESFFDMRAAAADRFTIEHLFSTLRYEVIHGPRLEDALSKYTGRTGRPPLPPAFTFGPWLSSDHWRDGGEVRFVVTRWVEEKIPGSVFVFDSPWEVAYNDFTWNETQFSKGGTYDGKSWNGFASASEMLAFLRAHGFKVVLWMTPFVNVASNDEGVPGANLGKASPYDELAAAGHLVRASPNGPPLVVTWWKGDGSPIDFTSPGARSWLQGRLGALVDASDGAIGGFKTDDGEADFIPVTASYADGRTGVEMRNGYSVDYHRTVWEVLGEDGVLLSRSGFTGTQAFPGAWSGDNEPNYGEGNGLPSVIVAGQSAAMSGFSIWGHDVGGYQDTNESATPADLFMRWTQFGAMSPIMQIDRQVKAGKQYPWSYGDEALANFRTWAKLHTRLFPYFYSFARRSAETGLPIVRPLVLAHQDDPECWPVRHTYLLGDSLLVAPIIENAATSRELYLPEGVWYDFWTSERKDGKELVTWTNADASKAPLYVREGAILPLTAADVASLCDADYVGDPAITTFDGSLELYVYPAASSRFDLYDGSAFECETGADAVTVRVASAPRGLRLRVLGTRPDLVDVDGNALPELAGAAELDSAPEGWAWADGFVLVKLSHEGGDSVIVLQGTTPPSGAGPGAASGGPGAGPGGGASSEEGCGCRTPGASRDHAPGGALAALALAVALRRRRTQKCWMRPVAPSCPHRSAETGLTASPP